MDSLKQSILGIQSKIDGLVWDEDAQNKHSKVLAWSECDDFTYVTILSILLK
jgi:hypothetical protein